MNKFKVELKKIEYSERMSEETMCFAADLYINGKNVGYCKNDGHGGPNDYNGNTKEDKQLIRECEEYCKTLPKQKADGYDFMYQPSLETMIDDFLTNWLKKKDEKKMKKLFTTAIVIGIPNADKYSYFNYKKPLSTIDKGKLQQAVMNIKTNHCKDGIVILNDNLKQLGIQI